MAFDGGQNALVYGEATNLVKKSQNDQEYKSSAPVGHESYILSLQVSLQNCHHARQSVRPRVSCA